MTSEARNEFGAEHQDRVRKIRKAAGIALKELDQLRSGGPMTQEALDAEIARIAREKLSRTDAISLFFGCLIGSRDS
jgi:hypothetical protein